MIILQYEYLNNYRYYHIPDRYKMRLKSKIMGMNDDFGLSLLL